MKKLTKTFALFACSALLAASLTALTACGQKNADMDASSVEENVQIPNPWVAYPSLEEAVKSSGIALTLPEEIGGVKADFWQAIPDELIEVRYGDHYSVRKGTGGEDISGDFNAYAEVTQKEIDGKTGTFKGNDGKVMLAVWTEGNYGYSVSADGLSAENMTSVVAAVK